MRLQGWSWRLEMYHAFAMTARMVFRVMMVMHRTLLLNWQVLLHTNHPVGMMMMGKNGCYQHDNVDKKQQRYYEFLLPFHPFVEDFISLYLLKLSLANIQIYFFPGQVDNNFLLFIISFPILAMKPFSSFQGIRRCRSSALSLVCCRIHIPCLPVRPGSHGRG